MVPMVGRGEGGNVLLHDELLADNHASCEAKVRAALAELGFGIPTEIDLEATLRTKPGAEIGP